MTDGAIGVSVRAVSGVFSAVHEAIGQRTRIGRDPYNDIVIDDPLVSRFHAELRARPDGRHELVDLGSRNGTFVNGRAVDHSILEELDLVSAGHHTFRLVGSGSPNTSTPARSRSRRPGSRCAFRTAPRC